MIPEGGSNVTEEEIICYCKEMPTASQLPRSLKFVEDFLLGEVQVGTLAVRSNYIFRLPPNLGHWPDIH